jgi:adenosylmethionine-8-amino-7-oxononanoate aminotransferase
MEPIMKEEMTKFLAKHKSAKNGRVHGLGAGIDLGDKHGNFLNEMHKPSPGIKVLKDAHIALGLTTLYRGHIMHCCPPLIIKPEQIREGFEILDKSFDHLDRWIEEQD